MARKRGARNLTPEQRAEQELGYAKVMGPAEAHQRLAFWRRLRPLVERSVASYRQLRSTATGRGERWSDTYHLRRAERELAEIDASVAALEAWVAGEPSSSYDAPAGAGESVEAYRG